jgi:hypothetical protein
VPGTASEPPDLPGQSRSRGAVTNPPVVPGRVASSARQIKVG